MVGCSANTRTASAISPGLFWSATHLSIHGLLFVLFILRACLAWLATALPPCVHYMYFSVLPHRFTPRGRSTTLPTGCEVWSATSSDRPDWLSHERRNSNCQIPSFCYQCYFASSFSRKPIGKEWGKGCLTLWRTSYAVTMQRRGFLLFPSLVIFLSFF